MTIDGGITRRGLTASGLLGTLAASAPAFGFEREGNRKLIVWGGKTPVQNLDPHQRFDSPHYLVQNMLYEPLVIYDGDPAEIKPWLAQSWESNDNASVWTFKLNAKARFQNGDPVDAEAVRFSFARALKINKAVAWQLRDVLDEEGISVVDPLTVRFTLKFSYPSFIGFVPWWFVVNPKQVVARQEDGDLGQKWMTQNAAGSGPFRIRRWDENAIYVLEARADYWNGWPQGDAARPAGVIYQLIREPSAQRQALVGAKADIVEGLTTPDYVQLRGAPNVAIESHSGGTVFAVKFNCQQGMTADRNLRRAIAHALDYKALPELYAGDAKLLTSPFPSIVRGAIDVPDFATYDLEKAKWFLAKTQWPNGGIELDYIHQQQIEETRRVGLLLLNGLQALNIKLNIKPLLWPNMVANAQKVETVPHMTGLFSVTYSSDPDATAYQYHKASWGQWFGMHWYNNPETFALIEKARSTAKWAERAPLYAEIQKKLVDDQPEIFGFVANSRLGRGRYVKGYEWCPLRPDRFANFHRLSIDA
jgi:peptide/nickel transport system substrate-binding protein